MRYLRLLVIVLLALTSGVTGCDLLESKDEENGESVEVSTTITPADGGSLVASDERVRLEFPDGAVTESTVVSITAEPPDGGFAVLVLKTTVGVFLSPCAREMPMRNVAYSTCDERTSASMVKAAGVFPETGTIVLSP